MGLLKIIPSQRQWKGWGLPGRAAYVAAVLGIPVAVVQLSIWGYDAYRYFQPAPQNVDLAKVRTQKQQVDANLKITDVGIGPAYDRARKYVYIAITNVSPTAAKSVRVDFYNYLGKSVSVSPLLSSEASNDDVDIAAGATKQFRVAQLEDYAKLFAPHLFSSELLSVSTSLKAQTPSGISQSICATQLNESNLCSFNTKWLSTIVRIRYGSMFSKEHVLLTQYYNTFLENNASK